MTDIVARLRAWPDNVLEGAPLCDSAADEIERLRARLAEADRLISVLAGFDQEHNADRKDDHPIFGVNSHMMLHGHARDARRWLLERTP